jgi:SSS family transporter
MKASFSALDYAILIFYVLGSVSLGLWFARKQNSVEGYYLAERSAPWWAVAISLISSDLTAISYMGCAALVFTTDLQISLGSIMMPAAAIFVAFIFVPFMARLRLFSVYEYLEHRFNVGVRTVASILFMLTRSSHLAVALYAAALALSEIIGVNIWFSLIILGGLTTLYTVFGGMKAVLWTDVAQFFVLMGGLVAVLVGVAIAFHWDIGMIWRIASHPTQAHAPWLSHGNTSVASHTRFFNFGSGFYAMTFWIIMINAFLAVIGAYGSDQVLVQRYLAAGSKAQMAKSLIAGGLITLPVNVLMYASGIFLVAYYNHFLNVPGHEWVSGLTDANRVMAHFVTHGIPGILGAIVIAGLFAGTMASLSAGLNSLSTVSYMDVWTRFGKSKTDSAKQSVTRAKLITLGWGVMVVFAARLVGGDETIFAILNKVMSPFAGPLLGMFLLGMLSKRANTFGVVAGAIFGAAATVFVTYVLKIHWLWYFVVGSMGSLVGGFIFSYLAPAPNTEEVGHLTYAGSRFLVEEEIPAVSENA